MPTNFQLFFLSEIQQDWEVMEKDARPNTLWVAEHEPVQSTQGMKMEAPVAAWFFNGSVFEPRPTSSFLVFMNLNSGYPHTTRVFEIGFGSFAPIDGTKDVSMFWQFAGLHGMGYLYEWVGTGFQKHEIWRS